MQRAPVVLTREPADNAELGALLTREGWPFVEWPAVATRRLPPPMDLRDRIETADWVAFTSRRGIEAAAAALAASGRRLEETLSGRRVAAVGATTARHLQQRGVEPVLVGDGRGVETFAPQLARRLSAGATCVLVRSGAADSVLPETLRRTGAAVVDVHLHEPVEPPPCREPERLLSAVVVSSPSAARHVVAWNPWVTRYPFVTIGPTTARAVEELGVARTVVARSPEPGDLLEAVRVAAGAPEDEE